MLKIAIVEDDVKTLSELSGMCERFFSSIGRKFFVQTYSDGMGFLSSFRNDYDVILLDIDMPLLNGLSTAKKIRESDDRCVIIFVTNLTQFVLKGYEVAASGYLLKPVLYEKLKKSLMQAVRIVDKTQKKTVALRTDNEVVVLNVDDIHYIEVMGHDLTVYTDEKTYTLKKTLSEFERALDGAGFARPNHSYLVNLKYVRSVVKNEVYVTVGGEDVVIAVSRNKKKPFIDALMNFAR